MMNNSHEISESGKTGLSAIALHTSSNFSALVAVAGLSKKTDFVGADLSNVDFSSSDLRGFDFTGADLSNTYGINFLIDETTILTSANVTSSVLQLEQERREYFTLNSEHYALFNRLKNEYWTRGAIWVGENLSRKSKDFETSAKIAKYLYASVKDQTYKNQILYGIKNTFASVDEYKAFLVDQLRDGSITKRSLRGIVDILGRSFGNDPDIARILLLFIGHEDREIRMISIAPVMKRKFFRRNKDTIVEHMNAEEDPDLRRLYSRCFAQMHGRAATKLLHRFDTAAFHDFRDEIDNRLFETLVRGYVRESKLETLAADRAVTTYRFDSSVSYKDFLDNIETCDGILGDLEKAGLPLSIKYNIDEIYPQLQGKREDSNFFRIL